MTTYLDKPIMIAGSQGLTVEHLGSIWVDYPALPGKGHRAGLSAVTLYGTVYAFGGEERSVSDLLIFS